MNFQEYDSVKTMTYDEYCSYLQNKYGLSSCDYTFGSSGKDKRSEIPLSWFHQHPQMTFDDGATQDFFFDYETAKKFYRKAIFDRVAKIEQNIREELRAIEDLCVKRGTSEAVEFYVDEYYDGRE